MTEDEFIRKWRGREDDVLLRCVSVHVRNCDDAECARMLVEARACAWINHSGVEICSTAAVELRKKKIATCRSEALRELDRRLTDQVDWALQLDVGNPRLSKPVLVVLVGAGFSKGFGLPLTADLRRLSLRRCAHPDPRGGISRLDTRRYPLSDFANSRIPDIEYLLTLWSGFLSQLSQTGYDIPEERSCYRLFLENACCHLHQKSVSAARSKRLAALARWLKEAVADYDVRFLTFNYDTVIELLCAKAGLRFTYLDRAADSTVIPIRKLHGSLNWRTFGVQLDSGNASAARKLYSDGQRSVYAFNDVSQFSTHGSADPPFIIPPSAGKEYDPLLRQVWRFGKGDIEIAEKILIVGYCFPPLDAFAEIHLAPSLRNRRGKITYVSPSKSDCKRVERLLGLRKNVIRTERWAIRHFRQITRGHRGARRLPDHRNSEAPHASS